VLWTCSRGAVASRAGGRKALLCDGRSLGFRGPQSLAPVRQPRHTVRKEPQVVIPFMKGIYLPHAEVDASGDIGK
jgi:hypothetical protein